MKMDTMTMVSELYILPSNHMTEEIQMPLQSSLIHWRTNQPANFMIYLTWATDGYTHD